MTEKSTAQMATELTAKFKVRIETLNAEIAADKGGVVMGWADTGLAVKFDGQKPMTVTVEHADIITHDGLRAFANGTDITGRSVSNGMFIRALLFDRKMMLERAVKRTEEAVRLMAEATKMEA